MSGALTECYQRKIMEQKEDIAVLEAEVAQKKSPRWAMGYLYVHGYLTDAEKARVERRIRKVEE